ncbi:hypothetical protein S40293_02269 [Stachybotrys chartarum IBT 40293]|nr:hypothetical protein S40293_02269 [Stachybotrys chartarum IBT 40293]
MGKDCCSGPPIAESGTIDDCCGQAENPPPCVDGCCDGGSCDDDAACDDASEADSEKGLRPGCCSSQGKCCDEECIKAAAAMECEKACDDDSAHKNAADHKHAHDKDGKHPASACSNHLSKAFEQYSAYVEAARCICRNILDRGLPASCCDHKNSQQQHATSAKGATGATTTATTTTTTTSTATGASDGNGGGCSARSTGHSVRSHTIAGAQNHPLKDESGSGIKHRGRKTQRAKDDLEIQPVDGQDSNSRCCSGDLCASGTSTTHAQNTRRTTHQDVEKDAALELVALVVDGMTCSGCANKLQRTITAAHGVSNVKVNFVRGTAEFNLDTTERRAEDVVKEVEKATGFSCTRLAGADQVLDLLAAGEAAKTLVDLAIEGVTQVDVVNKKMIRVSYDPAVIGARTLLESIGDLCDGLAPPADDPSVSSGRKRLYDMLVKTTLSAILTIPVVILAWGDNLVDQRTRAYVSVVLATLVQLIAVPTLYRPAILSLFHDRSIEMDMLVCISITAAYFYSIVAFSFRMANRPLETSEFFETSTLLITLILLGRLIAALARVRAVAAVSLRSLQAATAILSEGEVKEREIDARLLQFGDRFKVPPHTRVPTDGVVIAGTSEVDESMLTGESLPVAKQPGDPIIAGTVNGSGVLQARLTRLPGKNTVTDIAELVEEAANSKPKIQDLADRVASWFVPVVTAIAVAVTIIWIVIGFVGRREGAAEAIPNAITYAIAVLAVSCPCALGLAVPMVLVIAGGIAARGGVIIKTAECTAQARKVTDVVFDKTGTITEGALNVLTEEYFDGARDEAVAITKGLVASNNHPISVAVAKHLEGEAIQSVSFQDVRVIPGSGVETTVDGSILRAGTPSWASDQTHPAITRIVEDSMTVLLVARDSVPVALFGLRANIRAETATVISKLQSQNISVHLVSGDQVNAVQSTASSVGIPAENVRAKCTPAEKRDYVASLMSRGKTTMFCGDGTNDAVAVAQADVGVQLGSSYSSSDVTRGAADVVLLAGLEGIPFLLDVSCAAFHRMVFNFVWSAVYNVLAILLAAGAFVNFRIPPAYAGLGEMVSVLPVIFAAMTMLLLKLRA